MNNLLLFLLVDSSGCRWPSAVGQNVTAPMRGDPWHGVSDFGGGRHQSWQESALHSEILNYTSRSFLPFNISRCVREHNKEFKKYFKIEHPIPTQNIQVRNT